MDSPFRPRWVYNDGEAVDYSMSIPQRPWDFGSDPVGGSDISAAGVPATFEIRRDYLMHLQLRFPEGEWEDVERLVRHLQRAGSATFYPDRDEVLPSHTVYGVSPSITEEIRPTRDAEIGTLGLDITIRRTTETIFTDSYSSPESVLLTSGVPVEVSAGKWIGGTNLSEFDVAAGLPSGLTRYDNTLDGGTIEIKNDGTEGRYLAVTGAGQLGRYGIGVDAFDGLSGLDVEILVRTHVAGYTSGNRYWPGPACNMEGFSDADYRAAFGRIKWTGAPPNSLEVRIIKPSGGGGSTLLISASSENDIASGDWVWMRMRRQETDPPVSGDTSLKIKTWKGDYASEPGAWDAEGDYTNSDAHEVVGAVGWCGDWFSPDNGEHGVAFMSFTNEPDVTPPPTPSEIAG